MSTLHEAARRVVSAWVSTKPNWIEECNAAVLALDAALKAQPEPAGCETEADCTSQPWCRIRGACQRKQEQPEPAQEPVAFMEAKADNDCACAYADGWNACVEAHKHTTPQPQRPPLTDEEISDIYIDWDITPGRRIADLVRAIERKVRGEKE